MADLSDVLEASRPAIEAALAEAEQELVALNERRHELEGLIERARAALGEPATPPPAPVSSEPRLTLHEAMETVLAGRGNRWMTVHELAEEINRRGLYEKRDGTPVDPTQIHARANKYGSRFEKDGARIRGSTSG